MKRIALIIICCMGFWASMSAQPCIPPPPIPTVTFNPSSPCGREDVTLTASPPAINMTYTWTFDDGQVDTVYGSSAIYQFPQYENDTTYNVQLVVTDTTDGCTNMTTSPISILGTPDFSVIGTFLACLPSFSSQTTFDGSFTIVDGEPGATYDWDFGDGDVLLGSTDLTVMHTYLDYGTYDFSVQSSNGTCVGTFSQLVTFYKRPTANMSIVGDPDLCEGDSIHVQNNTNPDEVVFYVWDWGDGVMDTVYDNSANAYAYEFEDDIACNSPPPAGIEFVVSLIAVNECFDHSNSSPIFISLLPRATIDQPDTLCISDPTMTFGNLSCPSAASGYFDQSTYFWDFGDGMTSTDPNPTHTFPATGVYMVTLDATNDCGNNLDTVEVVVIEDPMADATVTIDSFCIPFQAHFVNMSTGDSLDIEWNVTPATGWNYINGTDGNSADPEIEITEAGDYLVELSATNFCGTDIWDTLIIAITDPTIELDSIGFFCDTLTLTPTFTSDDGNSQNATYAWEFPGGTPSSANTMTPPSVFYSAPGNYDVIVTIDNECGMESDTVSFLIDPTPPADAGPDLSFCIDDLAYQLTATPAGGVYTGQGVTADGLFTPIFVGVGTYQIYYANTNLDCPTYDTVEIVVYDLPVVDAGPLQSLCINEGLLTLTGATPAGGVWSGLGIIDPVNGIFDPTVPAVGSFNITYTYTDANSCVNSDFKTVEVIGLPVINAGGNILFCNIDEDIQITGFSPFGGTWTGPGITDTNLGLFNPNQAGGIGIYQVTYTFTDINGCTNTDVLDVNVIDLQAVNAGSDLDVCINDPQFDLSGNSPVGGVWSGPGIIDSGNGTFYAQASGIGTHELIYTVGTGSCTVADTMEISVFDAPTMNAGADESHCEDALAFNLSGFSPVGGLWSGTGITDTSVGTFDPQVSGIGTYTITYTYTDPVTGCTDIDVKNVTITPLPIVNAGAPTVYCDQPDNVTLTNYSPTGGTWSGPGIVDAVNGIFNAQSAGGVGDYQLLYTFTDANGCTGDGLLNVQVIAPTTVEAGESDTVCIGSPFFIQSGYSPLGGTWTGPGIINSNGGLFDPSIAGVGTHVLTYSFGVGSCVDTDTKEVYVAPLPTIDPGMDISVCSDSMAFMLPAFTPINGTWSGIGITDPSGIFDPQVSGIGVFPITLSYTDPITQCQNSASIIVTVNALPAVEAGNPVSYCNSPDNITLTNYFPLGGTWSGTGVIDAVNGVFNSGIAGGVGLYNLVYSYTDGNSCTNTDTLIVSIVEGDLVTLSPNDTICIDNGIFIQTGYTPIGGTWTGPGIINSNGGVLDPILAGVGVHTLTYTIGTGTCEQNVTKSVWVSELPTVDAGADEQICEDVTAYTLVGYFPATGGMWSGTGVDASGLFDPQLAGVGSHSLTYTYQDSTTGCINTDDKLILINPLPIVNAGDTATYCNTADDIQLSGFNPLGGDWTGPGIIDPVNGVFNAGFAGGIGTYDVEYTYTNSNGCTNWDTLVVDIIFGDTVNAGLDTAICVDFGLYNLYGSPLGGTWTGPGIVNPSGIFDPLVVGAGVFTLTYTYGTGTCLKTDDKDVLVGTVPIVNAGSNEIGCSANPPYSLTGFSPPDGIWTGSGITDPTGIFDPSVAGAGTHTLTYTYVNPLTGCTASDIKSINLQAAPVVEAGGDITICESSTDVVFNSYSPLGGVWTGTGIIDAINGIFNSTVAGGDGTYVVFYGYTSSNGCYNEDSLTVNVMPLPIIITGQDTAFCVDDGLWVMNDFSPIGGAWSGTGIVDPLGTFDPSAAGLGLHILTYAYGTGTCEVIETRSVLVGTPPIVTAGDDEVVCETDAIFTLDNFSPQGGYWTGPGIVDSFEFDPGLLGVGTYTITYNYTNNVTGCEVSDTRDITLESTPILVVQDTIVFCNSFDDIPLTGYTPTSGTWSGPGIVDANNGVFNTTIAGGEGTYTIYYEFGSTNGCLAQDSSLIEVIFGDTVDAGGDIAMCIIDGTVALNGFSPAGGTWTGPGIIDPLGIFDPVVAGEGLHLLTYTFGTGTCEKTDDIEIFVGTEPAVVAGPDEEVCLTIPPFALSGFNPPGGGWTGTGITDPSGIFDPSSAGVGIHTLIYSYTNPLSGCLGSATKEIEVVPVPVVNVGDTLIVCNSPDNLFLSGSPFGGVWSGPGVLDPLNGVFNTGSAGGVGQYDVIYTFTQNNGCDGKDTLVVDVIAAPFVDGGVTDTICINDGLLTLAGYSPLGGYWSGPGIIDSFAGVFNPILVGEGFHTVTYTYGIGTCEISDDKDVFVGGLPDIILGSDLNVCTDDIAFDMSGFSPQGGLWSGTGITDPISGTFDPLLVGEGTYTLTYTFTNLTTNCANQENLLVTVSPLPGIVVPDTVAYCNNTNDVLLEGYSPTGGLWSGSGIVNGTSGTFNTVLAGGEGQYTLVYELTDSLGCTNRDTTIIDVIFGDTVTAGPDIAICIDNGLFTLSDASPSGGTWSGTGIVDPSLGVFDPASSGVGTQVVSYTYGASTCEKTDDLTIIVGSIPAVDAGADEIFCLNDEAILISDQSPSGGYWLGTAVDSLGNFDPSIAGVGSHTLTYTFVNPITGCENSDTKTMIIAALPVVFVGDTITYCNTPTTQTLDGFTPAGGTWSGPGIVASSGEFNPLQAGGEGIYELSYTVVDANGCIGSDTLIIDVVYGDTVNAGPNMALCITDGNQVLSDYSPVGGIWSGAGIIDPVTGVFDPNVAGNGNHVLTYTYGEDSCEKTDSRTVTVGLVPPIFTGDDEVVCEDAGVFTMIGFSPTGGEWSGSGIVDSTGIFDPQVAGPGVHILTYEYIQSTTGCQNSDTKTVTVEATPAVDAGGSVVYCNTPDDLVLTNYSPTGGVWSGPGIVNGVFGVFNTSSAGGEGQYELVYSFTNPNGCFSTDTLLVDVIYGDTVEAGPTLNLCVLDGPTVVEGSPLGGTWSGIGVVDPSGTFGPGLAGVGTHTLTYTYGVGSCEKTDTKTIIVGGLPIVDAGADEEFCINDVSIQLAGFGPVGGTWTGTGVDSAGVFDPVLSGVGIFELTYTYVDSVSGCENDDVKFVDVNSLPLVNPGDTTLFCVWDELILLEGYSPTGGTWTGSGIVDPIAGTFSTTLAGGIGTYELAYSITDANGCTNVDTLVVVVEAGQVLDPGPDETVCIDNGLFQMASFTPIGGSWTGPGVIDGFSGVFDPSIAGVGIHQLTYTYGTGTCEREAVKNIEVYPLPFVNVGADAVICENVDSFALNPIPVGGTWTGSGIDSVGNFDPQAVGVGTYDLIYTYTNPATGCTNADTLTLTVSPLPIADFTHPATVCEDEVVTFINLSTGADSYLWNFGDAMTSVADTAQYSYPISGVYDVTLIAFSADGCTDTIVSQIDVAAVPVASFAMTPESGCAPLEVTFTDASTGLNLDYYWDFGNGQTSISPTPDPITFNQGILDTFYVVSLTVTNQCGTHTVQDTVEVSPIPVVDFGSDVSSGCTPLLVDFTNNTTGLADSYYWDFGNGQFSSDSIPQTQIFTADPDLTNYTVTLIASNQCGADTATTIITVQPSTITSFFNVDVTEGCQPLEVNFTNLSTLGSGTTWDFGDGSLSVMENPVHTFDTSGVFTVTLYSTNACGIDSSVVDITVYPAADVDFDMVNYSCVDDIVQFTNLSTDVLVSEWDFGDGAISAASNPSHAYDTPGTYTVTLTGYSTSANCPSTIVKDILIRENPEVDLSLDMSDGCSPLSIQFQNDSPIISYSQWEFGDGSSSVETNPSHTYVDPGTYAATLTNIDNWGCASDSSILNIIVYPSPNAIFDTDVEQLCTESSSVTFINQSTDATSYDWDFDNGTTSQFPSPEITYNNAGTYNVTLTASNPFGCEDTTVQPFVVYDGPTADFSSQVDDGCEDLYVEFYQEADNATTYEWHFGDGATADGNNVSHLYTEPGMYDVSLYISFNDICYDSITISNSVEVYQTPVADFEIIQDGDGYVTFANTSQNAVSYYWDLGDGTNSNVDSPSHRYEENGPRVVLLIATNSNGCLDSLEVEFEPDYFYGLQIPNAFSPEGGVGDVQVFMPQGFGLAEYHIQVFTHWGELMWESQALDDMGRPTEGWNGIHGGTVAPQGAYVWKVVRAEFIDGGIWQGMDYGDGKRKKIGSVTILR